MRWIHDVSTDTDDPPQFIALRETRLACANGANYSGLDATAHRQLYPDIASLVLVHARERVFSAALASAQELGWKIAAAIESEGRIEATATTRLLRFKDDVVIRIRSTASGARLDMRSASRVGKSDLGVNAKRIRTFLKFLDSTLKTNS